MPPKKTQEQPNTYIPLIVLPIYSNGNTCRQAFNKPVNIKKNIDDAKIKQLLKDKSIKKESQLQTHQYIQSNLAALVEDIISQHRKPPEVKKESKKDAKKDPKKEETIQEIEKPIEINYQKQCSQFYILADYPSSQQDLTIALQGGLKIDIIVVIHQKQPRKQPDYSLLGKQTNIEDYYLQINHMHNNGINNINPPTANLNHHTIVKAFKNHRNKQNNDSFIQSTVIVDVDYQKGGEKEAETFLYSFFKKLCLVTVAKNKYQIWKQQQSIINMVPPIKTVVKKEVQMEEKKDDKKGAKKDTKAQVRVQIVEQVVETPYESLPHNRISDLKDYHRVINQNTSKSIYKQIINCIVESIEGNRTAVTSQQIETISRKILIRQHHKNLNKIYPQNYNQDIVSIQYPYDFSLNTKPKISFPLMPIDISFINIKYNNIPNLSGVKYQYYISKFEELVRRQQPKFIWNFTDRKYLETLSEDKLWGLVNNEILNDPRIFSCQLEQDKTKLIVLAQINPPGRLLFNNIKFEEKVIPNLQKWMKQQSYPTKQYFRYGYQQCGNLSFICKNMMTSDNSIIRDQKFTIGDKEQKIIRVILTNNIFGIKSNQQNSFWLRNSTINLSIKNNKGIWIRKNQYMVGFIPYPTIFYTNKRVEQKRSIDCKGNITKHMVDGSVIIYFTNGDISEYKYGKWIKTNNKERIYHNRKQNVNFEELLQGQKIIRVRNDNTIFVNFPNGQSNIIFSDGTEVYTKTKPYQLTIKNPQGFIVRITFPSSSVENIIGHGSAFAYLGFNNILERSVDGYLFEFIDSKFSTHSYLQKYESNGVIHQDNIVLINLEDSIIKSSNSTNIVFMKKKQMIGKPTRIQRIKGDDQILNQRWLQLFTTIENHKQGVYNIDLNQGSIKTKDAQLNQFTAKISEESKIKIAVSFKIDEQAQEKPSDQYPNGFSIPQINYFLPPPSNYIPPRLFSIESDGTCYQYLSQSQIPELQGYHVQEWSSKQNTQKIIQMTYQDRKQCDYFIEPYTKSVTQLPFGLPQVLKPRKVQINLAKNNIPNVYHRVVKKIDWDQKFKTVNELKSKIKQKRNQRIKFQQKFKKHQK